MNDLLKAKETLLSGGFTCVLCKGESVATSQSRGVRPLVSWQESRQDFQGYSAADKVVGKATAFLYALLGVKAVYAGIISRSALEVLVGSGIHAEYGALVDNIINRAGDGICPFEQAVLSISEPEEAYRAICEKMKEMNMGTDTI